ncbi:MAG: hypothetical protein FWH38_05600 [Treponema sp.]|nr:hypothetical protein [Treponema sp.]
MRPAGKTACLLFLFLFIIISSFYAQTFPDDELPLDEGLLFFEEFFVFEDAFSLEPPQDGDSGAETTMGGPPIEEIIPGEEALLGDETFFGGETPLSEETNPGGEALLGDETFSGGEIPLGDETLPGGETFLSDDVPPGDEDFLAGGTFIDEDAFFFEAPPLIFEVPKYQMRSLDAVFPSFSRVQRILAMSDGGLKYSFSKGESPSIVPDPDLGIDLLGTVMKKNPSHLIEALVVVPYREKELDLLDIYNALGRIGKIKDHPASFNGNDFYIFTESTRIESSRNRRAISDPLPAAALPFSETMYLRLKEVNYGNLFIRGEISISMYGITYNMTNFTDVRYFLIPIMRAERFTTIIYLEPVKEGILIYSMSGFYLPGFIADRVNLTPNINRRIEIFINWITDGLREQERKAAE